MQRLPSELILEIAECLGIQTNINHFAQVNRRLYALINPYLYRENASIFGSTALLWAARHGNLSTTRFALEQGADTSLTDESGLTPLSLACLHGQAGVVAALLRAQPEIDLNRGDEQLRKTPLSLAAACGHAEIVKLLLSKELLDPNTTDVYGRSALWCAAFRGRAAVVRMLLTHPRVELNLVDDT